MLLTNLERWRFYMKDRPSPQSWIDFGWLFVVSAALQRRVWFGNLQGHPLFCNLYGMLIGPPATGKNLVISPAKKLLAEHAKNPNEAQLLDNPNTNIKRLIEMGPDAVTFEKLCEKLAAGTSRFTYRTPEGKEAVYAHSSMAFVLEEANSLFTRANDKIPKLLLKGYDCDNYDYETKNHGVNSIRKTCISFLGGGTPSLLKEADKFAIFDDGFTSRVIFLFEPEPRHFRFSIGDIDDEQIKEYQHLHAHVKKLTSIFGQLIVPPECTEYLEHLFTSEIGPQWQAAGHRMKEYLGRMRVHIPKLAAAFHFSDSLDLTITLADFKNAVEFLHRIKHNMQIGFSAIGRNPLHPIGREMLRYISARGGCSTAEMLQQFQADITFEELTILLETLKMSQEIYMQDGKWKQK